MSIREFLNDNNPNVPLDPIDIENVVNYLRTLPNLYSATYTPLEGNARRVTVTPQSPTPMNGSVTMPDDSVSTNEPVARQTPNTGLGSDRRMPLTSVVRDGFGWIGATFCRTLGTTDLENFNWRAFTRPDGSRVFENASTWKAVKRALTWMNERTEAKFLSSTPAPSSPISPASAESPAQPQVSVPQQ